jgi:hypothetical protein
MEITKEEFNGLNEAIMLLQQVDVKGRDNMHLMSGIFSRLETIIQEITKRESAKPLEAKKEG